MNTLWLLNAKCYDESNPTILFDDLQTGIKAG